MDKPSSLNPGDFDPLWSPSALPSEPGVTATNEVEAIRFEHVAADRVADAEVDIASASAATVSAIENPPKKPHRKLPWFVAGVLGLTTIGGVVAWNSKKGDLEKSETLVAELDAKIIDLNDEKDALTSDLKDTRDTLDETVANLLRTEGELTAEKAKSTDLETQLAAAPTAITTDELTQFAEQIIADYAQLTSLPVEQLKVNIDAFDARQGEFVTANVNAEDVQCKNSIAINGFTSYQLAAVSLYNLAVTKSPAYLQLASDVTNSVPEVESQIRRDCGL